MLKQIQKLYEYPSRITRQSVGLQAFAVTGRAVWWDIQVGFAATTFGRKRPNSCQNNLLDMKERCGPWRRRSV